MGGAALERSQPLLERLLLGKRQKLPGKSRLQRKLHAEMRCIEQLADVDGRAMVLRVMLAAQDFDRCAMSGPLQESRPKLNRLCQIGLRGEIRGQIANGTIG